MVIYVWYRVFAATDAVVEPAALLEHLQRHGHQVVGHFRGDNQGWFSAKLVLPDEETAIDLERYLASEKGIREELNSWAACLETQQTPQRDELMRRVIQSRQVFAVSCPPEAAVQDLCEALCRYLAQETEGVYQIDGRGFIAADGTIMIADESFSREPTASAEQP